MSSSKQATVTPIDSHPEAGLGTRGHRNDASLRSAFPATPIFPSPSPEYSDLVVASIGVASLNGNGGDGDSVANIGVSEGIINDAGYMFGTLDLNYTDSPDVPNLDIAGGGGKPASPHVPNLSSAPTTFPASQPEFDESALPNPGVEYGSGLGGLVSPKDTSDGISGQSIKNLRSGRSYPGSDGLS